MAILLVEKVRTPEPNICFWRMVIVLYIQFWLGVISWKKSPPKSKKSTLLLLLIYRISSKASNESFSRIWWPSLKPRWLSVEISILNPELDSWTWVCIIFLIYYFYQDWLWQKLWSLIRLHFISAYEKVTRNEFDHFGTLFFIFLDELFWADKAWFNFWKCYYRNTNIVDRIIIILSIWNR